MDITTTNHHLTLSLLLLLLQPLTASFHPTDNYLLNCGATATVTLADGRTFYPDVPGPSSSFSLAPISHNVVTTTAPTDLYGTARVVTQLTHYQFIIQQPGRHFIRLHFSPIANPLYNLRSSSFSVAADGFTLLHDYSSRSHYPSVVSKEYIVQMGLNGKPLTLALSPSNGSVAFINAVEVVSLPEDCLLPSAASPVPPGPSVQISTDVAFETVFRVNMGGQLVIDSLWRSWEPDWPYLINAASAHSVFADPESIRYPSGVSNYTAPNSVYATAQEMANANVGNQNFNISWLFAVDPGFRYLVRLHFCDVISEALIFNVYINNQSALSSFDISSKTIGLAAAWFVDFVVDVRMDPGKILVQVGPSQLTSILPNAILNGLEIMKISNSGGSLAASHSASPFSYKDTKKQRVGVVVIASCLGGTSLLGFMVVAFILHFYCRKKAAQKQGLAWLPPPTPLPFHTSISDTKVSAGSYASSGPSLGLGQLLAFSEIREATENFDENFVLGVGGFGKVYKGVLENGLQVAVKRGNPRSQQGLVEFRTEIEMLSKLRHRHLVSLIGYCHEPNEMVLVYEFMAGGPLRKHLYGSDLPTLSWKQRLEICIGAAKGLHYLHTGAAETIIHRDVKTTNILLDENLTAKVADFGLSKLGPTLDQTHVSTAVKGSFGYLDPEYFRRQQLTEKSDVYSFGVVLMEVLCARPAINPSLPRDQVNIVDWAMNWQKQGQLERIIDPHLVGTVSLDSLRKFGETAEKCLAEHGIERPTMGDVLWNLEYALQLQESFSKVVAEGSSTNGIQDLPEWIPHLVRTENNYLSFVSDATDAATTRAFSQLMDPKGR